MNKPILVTGAHRSGTTWVGKIIAQAPGIHYVHEPFNIDCHPGAIHPFYWFHCVSSQDEIAFYEYLKPQLWPQGTTAGRGGLRSFLLQPTKRQPPTRALMKDPIALFSAPWLAERFDMNVIVMIRHPAAFVASLQQVNWTHDFSHFLKQPALMSSCLFPFTSEIQRFVETKHDVFDQGILLWKLIYHAVSRFRQQFPRWLFLRHEDLSLGPQEGFRKVFKHISIPMRGEIRNAIDQYSHPSNPINGDVHLIQRNSRGIVKNWRNRFTSRQIQSIRDGVGSIANEFYSDQDWE